jgi:iron complex transport system substrate-binding protein
MGETCVPLKPKRIITLSSDNTLDALIALGIKPIGFTSFYDRGKKFFVGVSFDEVAGAKDVGNGRCITAG